jgi:glycosyltransferase involved in cell wall biosynthesis
MKTIIFRGPFLTQSGYGVHARQVARWLLSRSDIDAKFVPLPWGDTPWIIDQDAHGGLIGQIMQKMAPMDCKGDLSFQLQLPNEWDPKLAPKNIGITAAVETDRCNPEWIAACNAMTTIIVPSQHAKNSLTNTGRVDRPIMIVPESFDDAVGRQSKVQLPKFSTPFNFLIFGQLTGNRPENDRKNILYTLKWLTDVFKDDPEVGIVLKTNSGRNSKIDRISTQNTIASAMIEARRGSPGPKLHLLHGDMNDEEVSALYRHDQIKALVSLTRGEGYGLPILESAAAGLPIMATGWSGHLDFLKHGKYISVYYSLSEVHPSRIDGKIFVPGARWATPSEDDFKKRVVKFRHNPEIPRQWAQSLSTKILEKYSFNAISSMYDQILKEHLT